MKIGALILALLGILASIGLGAKWVSDFNQYKDQIAQMQAMADQGGGMMAGMMDELNGLKTAGYLMMLMGLASVGGVVMLFKNAKIAGGIFLVAAILPGVFAAKALVATFFLLIAGILAMLVKPAAV